MPHFQQPNGDVVISCITFKPYRPCGFSTQINKIKETKLINSWWMIGVICFHCFPCYSGPYLRDSFSTSARFLLFGSSAGAHPLVFCWIIKWRTSAAVLFSSYSRQQRYVYNGGVGGWGDWGEELAEQSKLLNIIKTVFWFKSLSAGSKSVCGLNPPLNVAL